MLNAPIAAMDANHSTVTGPNTRPTFAVPKRCETNSRTRITTDSGTMNCSRCGAATSMPSTAPSTDTAGVITPSPKNRDAPKMPRMPTA